MTGFAVETEGQIILQPGDDVTIEVWGDGPPLIHVGTTPPDPEASPLWLDIS